MSSVPVVADRARIVDQDVDPAEFVRRLADGFGHPLLVPDVDHQRKRPAAGLVDLLGCRVDRALKLRMRLRRLCGDGDIRAVLRCAQRYGKADTPAATGYEDSLACQAHLRSSCHCTDR